MRCYAFAAVVGVFSMVLAGCPTELLPPGADSPEDEQPVPASSEGEQPPPPPPPPPSPPPSPEQLARQALEAPTADEQEVAAVRLAGLGKPAKEHLRRVLSESQSPAVRAACIGGLAVQWDYDSMPTFLDALDDDSELVRGRAGTALERMMSVDFGYRYDDPPEKRAAAVKRFREHWGEFRDSETLKHWKKRLEEREQREERQRPQERPSAVAPDAGSGTHVEPSARPYPRFPDAVTKPPAWGDKAPPFDLAKFLEAPPEGENAAPLYLDALAEFGPEAAQVLPPEERKRREPIVQQRWEKYYRLDEARRKNTASVSDAEIDAWLAEYETGFQKLAFAQQRPQCVFQTGLSLESLLSHAQAARMVAWVVNWRTRRDLARGDFERPIQGLQTVLRLSRDLRPRGVLVCQLVSIAMDGICCQQMVLAILTTPGIKAQHCDCLLALLAKYEAEAADPFSEGYRAEYFMWRKMLDDFQHRTGTFDPRYMKEELKVRGPVDSPVACIQLLVTLGDSGGPLARQRWPGLFDRRNPAEEKRAGEEFAQRINAMTPDDYAQEADALNRVYASILALAPKTNLQRLQACTQPALVEPLRGTTLAVFMEPLKEPLIQPFLRADATLRGTKCLIALRRWQLEHPQPPRDLASVVRAAGMPGVPLDPYCDQPLRTTVIGGKPVVYSVGKDGRDDRALVDWQNGQQPGDFVFRIEPPSD